MKKLSKNPLKIMFLVAERAGFEPAKELPLYTLSKRAPSTTRPPLPFKKATYLTTCYGLI